MEVLEGYTQIHTPPTSYGTYKSGVFMAEETYQDIRQDQEGDFAYGPGESPDYVEYIPEALALLDLLMETPPGSPDALRLARLVRQKMWKEL